MFPARKRCLLSLFLLPALALLLAQPAAQARRFSTVVIDPGHGGFDRGGIPYQRVSEKAIALDIALRLNKCLKRAGFRTVMTRSRDVFISLPGRCAIANRQRNAIFVSIHTNSAKREGAYGIETYYDSASGRPIAAAIQRSMLRATHSMDRHIHKRGFYVLRKTRIPAVLVECGFMTNRREAALTLHASYRQKIAEAIASAIVQESHR